VIKKFRNGSLAYQLKNGAYKYDEGLKVKVKTFIPKRGDWYWPGPTGKESKIAWDAICHNIKNIEANPATGGNGFYIDFYDNQSPEYNPGFFLEANEVVASLALCAINTLEMIDRDDINSKFDVEKFYKKTEEFIFLMDLASEKLKARLKVSQPHLQPSPDSTPPAVDSGPGAH